MFNKYRDPLAEGLKEASDRAKKARTDLEKEWKDNYVQDNYEYVASTDYDGANDEKNILETEKPQISSEETNYGEIEEGKTRKRPKHILRNIILLYIVVFLIVEIYPLSRLRLLDRGQFSIEEESQSLLSNSADEDKDLGETYLEAVNMLKVDSKSASSWAEIDRQKFREINSYMENSTYSWVRFLSSNYDALRYRLSLFELAKERIDMMVYDFELDESSILILQGLRAAAERGVMVRLVIDGFPALIHSEPYKIFMDFASLPNVSVRVYNRLSFIPRKNNYRLHSKLLIVDDNFVVVGGRNISDKFLATEDNGEGNEDLDVITYTSSGERTAYAKYKSGQYEDYKPSQYLIKASAYFDDVFYSSGEGFEKRNFLQAIFAKLSRVNEKNFDFNKDQYRKYLINGSEFFQYFYPVADARFYDNGNDGGIEKSAAPLMLLFNLIKNVADEDLKSLGTKSSDRSEVAEAEVYKENNDTKESYIYSPYVVLTDDMLNLIEEMGISDKFTMVTNGPELSPNPFTSSILIKDRRWLLNYIPKLRENIEGRPLHTKAALISDRLFSVSSMNFDPRSIKMNAEIMMIFKGKLASRALRDMIFINTIDSNDAYVLQDDIKWYQKVLGFFDFLKFLY